MFQKWFARNIIETAEAGFVAIFLPTYYQIYYRLRRLKVQNLSQRGPISAWHSGFLAIKTYRIYCETLPVVIHLWSERIPKNHLESTTQPEACPFADHTSDQRSDHQCAVDQSVIRHLFTLRTSYMTHHHGLVRFQVSDRKLVKHTTEMILWSMILTENNSHGTKYNFIYISYCLTCKFGE